MIVMKLRQKQREGEKEGGRVCPMLPVTVERGEGGVDSLFQRGRGVELKRRRGRGYPLVHL
jgi:hypothetical protein